jgi:hypothetical protein
MPEVFKYELDDHLQELHDWAGRGEAVTRPMVTHAIQRLNYERGHWENRVRQLEIALHDAILPRGWVGETHAVTWEGGELKARKL